MDSQRRLRAWISSVLAALTLAALLVLGVMDVFFGEEWDSFIWWSIQKSPFPVLAVPALVGTIAVAIAVIDACTQETAIGPRQRVLLVLLLLNVLGALWYWWSIRRSIIDPRTGRTGSPPSGQ